jgi:hypothetical protein
MPPDAEHVRYTIAKAAQNVERIHSTNSIIKEIHKITLHTKKGLIDTNSHIN